MRESPLVQDQHVPSHCEGQRTDVVLAQLFPHFSRTQLSNWLKDGQIKIDHQHYKPKNKLAGGELIQLRLDPLPCDEACLAEDLSLNVVFEDDDLLIINKPAGLVVHPGAGHQQHTLVNALLHHAPQLNVLPRAGIIHRLDKDTTGLLIVAKHHVSYTQLIRDMQARTIQRRYKALVHGDVLSSGTLSTFYGRHPHHRLKMAVCAQGREAITSYRVEKKFPLFTLLEVQLFTGRTHQIRVHMAHIRHPIVGDQLYTGTRCYTKTMHEDTRHTLQLFQRQALHAYSLTLQHPCTQEVLHCHAPLPEDFQHLLQQLTLTKDSL